jgi:hypothetical protein
MTRGAWAIVAFVALAAVAPGDAWLHRARSKHGRAGRFALDVGEGAETLRPERSRCQGARDDQAIPDILAFNLRSAPFPSTDHPDVAVHVPDGFDGTLAPGLVVFFHGFENCVTNVVGEDDGACSPDGPVRDALHLARQLDDAHVNAILVAVEGPYDVAAGDPGNLLVQGSFRELLHELIVEHLNERIGCELDVDDLTNVVLASHSGGYQATSAALRFGDVPVRAVALFDSLYGEQPAFTDWITTNASRFDATRDDALRWLNVYTCCGGTSDNSRVMAGAIANALVGSGREDALTADDTVLPLSIELLEKPIVFKQTDLAHGDVPKTWFGAFLGAAGFAPRRE